MSDSFGDWVFSSKYFSRCFHIDPFNLCIIFDQVYLSFAIYKPLLHFNTILQEKNYNLCGGGSFRE